MKDKTKIAVSTYERIAGIYAKRYFEDLSDSLFIDKFLKKIPPKASLLDAGCGPGQFAAYMASKGYVVTGIDLSKVMISLAKKKVKEAKFVNMDMRHMNFNKNTFDGILAAYSLIHIASEDLAKTLLGFYKVLKPGGYLEIIVQEGNPDMIIDEPFLPTEKMFFNFFTRKRIMKLLERSGFDVEFSKVEKTSDPFSVGERIIYIIAKKI